MTQAFAQSSELLAGRGIFGSGEQIFGRHLLDERTLEQRGVAFRKIS